MDRKGIHTSEFWLSLGATAAAFVTAIGLVDAAEVVRAVAAAVAAIVPAVYTLARTLLKRG